MVICFESYQLRTAPFIELMLEDFQWFGVHLFAQEPSAPSLSQAHVRHHGKNRNLQEVIKPRQLQVLVSHILLSASYIPKPPLITYHSTTSFPPSTSHLQLSTSKALAKLSNWSWAKVRKTTTFLKAPTWQLQRWKSLGTHPGGTTAKGTLSSETMANLMDGERWRAWKRVRFFGGLNYGKEEQQGVELIMIWWIFEGFWLV